MLSRISRLFVRSVGRDSRRQTSASGTRGWAWATPRVLVGFLSLGAVPVAEAGAGEEEEPLGPALAESESCALCHSNAPAAVAMRDAAGREIAPFDLWRSSMMANSALDPLWRAAVSVEVAATPSRKAEIEATCLRCHAPMADRVGLADHGTGTLMHVLDCDATLGDLARDGVSCTVCHGISPDGLGLDESFSGRFRLDDQRRIYGPHSDPFTRPMQHHTTFVATEGAHVLSSALCATCHTLKTETLDAEGRYTGAHLMEQTPYLEWRNSSFRDEVLADGTRDAGPHPRQCQECHVPRHDADGQRIEARIARNPGGRDFPPIKPRSPYGRHLFVGGNTLMLSILRDHGEELGSTVPAVAFEATRAATELQLRERTAGVAIQQVTPEADRLRFDVEVQNRCGHKLPTGHPTRRMWLEVVVEDAQGDVLWRSGTTDSAGRIVDDMGMPLAFEEVAGPVAPHRDVVRHSSEVPTYEAVPADMKGQPVHLLLRAASWWKDDRLLPLGWSDEHSEAARTRPVGLGDDPNFEGGRDTVHYDLKLAGAAAARIRVHVRYQPLSARWAAELLHWKTPETERFARLYEQADRRPQSLASAVWEASRTP